MIDLIDNVRYHAVLAATLIRLNYPKPIPTSSYISQNMKHFAPMIFPNIAGVTDFVSGAGNPNLNPLLREEKIRSSVENCAFFGVFASATSKKDQCM